MSATETITLPLQVVAAPGPSRSKDPFSASEAVELSSINSRTQRTLQDEGDGLPPPTTAVDVLERWNYPKRNVYGICGTYLSFFILGMNDASPGALIPYLERYYDLSYTVVSLLFLSPCVGYSLAAAFNNSVHRTFGQRGVAFIAGMCHFITYLTFSLHPPWPVIVVFFIFAGFGNGLADAGWCAWTGNMASANKVQGFLQSFYSAGATISPLIATTLVTQGQPWYTWYYIMVRLFRLPAALADVFIDWLCCPRAGRLHCCILAQNWRQIPFRKQAGDREWRQYDLGCRQEQDHPLVRCLLPGLCGSRSRSWRLDRYLHAARPKCYAICLRYLSYRLLGGHDSRPCSARFRHRTLR